MGLDHVMAHASGRTLTECWFVGYRFDEEVGFRWDEMESWVVSSEQDILRSVISQAGWLSGMWRSLAGHGYACHVQGQVHHWAPGGFPDGSAYRTFELDAALGGIWGLDDELVFCWGEYGPEPRMWVWDGQTWNQVELPGQVNAVHGVSRDLVYAVGPAGLILRWNGGGWDQIGSSSDEMFSAVHVVSDTEMYICGATGHLLEGSIHGWSEVLWEPEMQLSDVTRFADRVLVAARRHGLLELVGGKLVEVSTDVEPDSFDNRASLLISTPTAIWETPDMAKFRSRDIDKLEGLIGTSPPIWWSHPI